MGGGKRSESYDSERVLAIPALEDVHAAHTRIHKYIHQTPVVKSRSIDSMVGASLLFKCEALQKTGAFKARGAVNAVLSANVPEDGFVTHSSGNHGAALAWAAGLVGSKATVVVPETALPEKLESMERYGAQLVFCGSKLESRESTLEKLSGEGEYREIPPYDHFDIVAGQGTCALEFLGVCVTRSVQAGCRMTMFAFLVAEPLVIDEYRLKRLEISCLRLVFFYFPCFFVNKAQFSRAVDAG